MKTKKKARGEPMQRLYSEERVAVLARLTRQLWAEMRAWLMVMEAELTWLGGGGEAPVLACRARALIMRGAMQGLGGELRRLCAEAGDEIEAWRWLEEFDRVMSVWLKTLEKDLKEIGTTPSGEDPRDDTWFTPEYGMALGLSREVYRDWRFAAWTLASIETSEVAAGEIERIDQKVKFVEVRRRARRGTLRGMPEREMDWR